MSGTGSPLDELLSGLVGKSSKNENGGDGNASSRRLQSLLHSGHEDPLLDSALAMLGFTCSAVQQTLSILSGETLIKVLSSSIASASKSYFGRLENAVLASNASTYSCFLGTSNSHHEKPSDDEHICGGTPFSISRTRKVMEEALSFLKGSKLEDQLILDLLEVLVKVYSLTSTYKSSLAGSCLLYERDEEQEETLASTFLDQLIELSLKQKEVIYNQFCPSIRLLLWRLQPGLLVQDLSAILETIAARPLMSLKNEFRRRQGWFNLVLAMASGPDMFKEGRQLLNAWLLASGAPCVWELKVDLGVMVRDVLEHPSSWDLSEEVGICLPTLSAFYGGTLHSVAMMLSRPPSWAGLRELGILLENSVGQDVSLSASFEIIEDPMRVAHAQHGMETAHADMACPDSLWMLLMDFPAWIQFAFFSLFQRPSGLCKGVSSSSSVGSGHSDDLPDSNHQEHIEWLSHQETAAGYIAWLFSPQDEKLRGLVVQMLRQVVEAWLHIKDEECHFAPARKRRRVTTGLGERVNPSCDEQKGVKVEMFAAESLQREERRKLPSDHMDSWMGPMTAVRKWLLSFQDCCRLLISYSQGGTSQVAAHEIKQQAKRRLVLSDGADEVAMMTQDSQQPEAVCPQCKSFSFFDGFPLVALSCSPFLQNDAVVHLVLHSVMVGSGFLPAKKDGFSEGRKGLACKEPLHRTEDFRDACQDPFCSNFACDASAWTASGVSRVFKFLEILDLLEYSSFINGSHGSQWLHSFKEAMARHLQMCMRSWSQQAESTSSFTMLDDFQHRASLWAARMGLESKILKDFKQALQVLDILIASAVVDEPF